MADRHEDGDDDDRVDCEHAPAKPSGAALDREVVERAAAFFRAAGDPSRLRLLYHLSHHGECCVSELADVFGEGMSTVSQRLRTLRAERLVTRRREGKHIYYALADDHVIDIIRDALEHAREDH